MCCWAWEFCMPMGMHINFATQQATYQLGWEEAAGRAEVAVRFTRAGVISLRVAETLQEQATAKGMVPEPGGHGA